MTTSADAFRLLGAAQLRDYTTRDTETRVAAGLVKHAVDPVGHRLLLVPISDSTAEVEDQRSKGVTVETGTLIEGDGASRHIFVRCEDNSLVDLFSTVCDEILVGCAALPDQPGNVVRHVLDRWRKLLGPSRGHLLGDSEIKGLLAELHVLEQIAKKSPSKALDRWTGSDKTRHDFSGPRIACEVKASAMIDEVRVRIHGLAQLLAPAGGDLILFIERLEPVPAGGDCVPDAVARLIDLGLDRAGLLLKLQAIGAYASDFKVYERIRFKTLETRAYAVDPLFPRLTPDVLEGTPAEGRVHSVEYVLDLAAKPPEVLSKASWSAALSLLLADDAS